MRREVELIRVAMLKWIREVMEEMTRGAIERFILKRSSRRVRFGREV